MTVPAQRVEECRKAKDQGSALLAKGKVDGALKEFQRALQLAPDDVAARKKVAEILARLGRNQEAIAQYQHLAGKYAADGLLVQAIAVNKAILQLDPGHRQVQETLAGLYARKDEGDKSWVQKIPASMTAALDVRHVRGPRPAVIDLPEAEESMKIERSAIDTQEVDIEIDTARLPATPLFSELPRDVFMALLSEVQIRAFAPGQVLVREGDPGDAMYVVAHGEVDVVRHLGTPEQKAVLSMREGTFFGEIALVTRAARLASVVARTECELLEVNKAVLEKIVGRFPDFTRTVQHFCKERLLANLLRSSDVFRLLSDGSRHALADRFRLHQAAAGEVLLVEGEPGRGLFVILRGRCEVAGRKAGGGFVRYPDLAEGAVFGETSLLSGGSVTASVRTVVPSLLLGLDRQTFADHILPEPKVVQALRELSLERLERTRQLGGAAALEAESFI
ncbi:MAG: cyclic nucleotide-binding domain-containing protein [Myxococcales bacterium]